MKEGAAHLTSEISNERPVFGRPLTDLAFARSVRAGNLWLPPSALTSMLGRHCVHIFCLNNDATFPYSLRGSGGAINIDGRNFVFFFKHQALTDYYPEQLVIAAHEDSKILVSGSEFYFCGDAMFGTDDHTDLYALGFDLKKYRTHGLERRFFTVLRSDVWPHNTLGHFLIYGFPSKLQNICPEGKSIAGTLVHVAGSYDSPSNSRYLHRIKLSRKTCFDCDGLSGGIVLHLGRDRLGFFVGLAGFISRGGSQTDYAHFVEAKPAFDLAEYSCNRQQSQLG